MTVAVIGWLATWPAEAVRGWIISDQALNPEVRDGRVYPTDALIVVLSDHGFQAWTPSPKDPFPFLSGNHSPDAVLILAGPDVRRGARLNDPRVVDIAPTLLRYLNVPPPTGQSGRALDEAFNPGVLLPALAARAPSRLPRLAAPSALSTSEAERLRALGYLR